MNNIIFANVMKNKAKTGSNFNSDNNNITNIKTQY